MMRCPAPALVVLALLLPAIALPQRGATVLGGVTDAANGNSLSGVTVQVSDSLSAQTDDRGEFTLDAVPPGTYQATLSRSGYRPKTLSVEVGRNGRRLYLAAVLAGADADGL